jgi:hypothetical protein
MKAFIATGPGFFYLSNGEGKGSRNWKTAPLNQLARKNLVNCPPHSYLAGRRALVPGPVARPPFRPTADPLSCVRIHSSDPPPNSFLFPVPLFFPLPSGRSPSLLNWLCCPVAGKGAIQTAVQQGKNPGTPASKRCFWPKPLVAFFFHGIERACPLYAGRPPKFPPPHSARSRARIYRLAAQMRGGGIGPPGVSPARFFFFWPKASSRVSDTVWGANPPANRPPPPAGHGTGFWREFFSL